MENKIISWQEKIYWTHFNTIHFSQFLLSGFKNQLAIPDKFAKNLKHKLPGSGTVTLRGPSGITWDVGLMEDHHRLYFKLGWQQFVCDNSLEENDFLVFRYNGQSQFDVLMFDSSSLCEKEAAYFVKGHGSVKREDCATATTKEECVSSEMTLKEIKRKAKSQPSRLRTKRVKLEVGRGSSKRKMGCANNSSRPTSIIISDEEKEKALKAAQAAANSESAIVVVKPAQIYRKLVMPKEWLTKHASMVSQNVSLRHENKTWHTRLFNDKLHGSRGLGAGWKTFVVDNKLREYDVCVFQPVVVDGSDSSIILDVSIFRVVQDLTPKMEPI